MLLRSLLLTLGVSICTLTTLWAQPQYVIDSLTLQLETETDSFNKSNYAYQIGFVYLDTDPKKGLEYTKLAIQLLPKDSITHLAQGYNILGTTYTQLYPDSLLIAIDYFNKALTIFDQVGLDKFVGDTYVHLANAHVILNDYEAALEVLYKAKEKYALTKSYQNLDRVHSVLTSINIKQRDHQKGINNAKQDMAFLLQGNSRDHFSLQKQPYLMGFSLYHLGLSHLKMKQLDSAEYYFSKALFLFEKSEYKNHIFTTATSRYESEKKEWENRLLIQELDIQTLKAANQEQLMYGILGLFILIVIILILVMRQNRMETNRRMQQLNHQLLLNQMSPHFIFNALTAIQSFVYKNDPRKAGKYLSSFAKLMRAILENSSVEYIPLAKELQWLDNYLRLQALRFNNKFEYEVIVDEALEVDGILLPPMLIQPFIENAVEHGIKDLEIKGILTIQFKLEDEQLAIYVEDNGVGFDVIQPKKSNHISLATKITKERLELLNQGNQDKIGFNISSTPNMGTAVSFSIPVQYS